MDSIKNFYNTEDIDFLSSLDISQLCKTSLQDYNNYLNHLPATEAAKLYFFRNLKLTMTTLMIKFSEFKVYEDDSEDYLFNFFFNTPQEKNYSANLKAMFKKFSIDKIYNLKETSKTYFDSTLNYLSGVLDKNFHSAHYMVYNHKCEVKPHNHSDGILSIHFLLNDITNGKMIVNVNDETKVLQKAGEYFIFDPMQVHSAAFEGNETTFLMVNVTNPFK
jgi:quercetin dioxygenase-like cupin family protein